MSQGSYWSLTKFLELLSDSFKLLLYVLGVPFQVLSLLFLSVVSPVVSAATAAAAIMSAHLISPVNAIMFEAFKLSSV